jgi:phage replication O-like protein O
MAYDKPNYTQIPNKLLDEHLPVMEKSELKVVLIIARQTLGWHKDWDILSLTRLQHLTGLGRDAVIAGVRAAIERGVIEQANMNGTNAYQLVVGRTDQQGSNESDKPTSKSRTNRPAGVGSTDTQKKGKKGKKDRELSPKEQERETLARALCDIAELDFELNKRDASVIASALIGAGYVVKDALVFRDEWFRRDKPGGKLDRKPPSLWSIKKYIGWVRNKSAAADKGDRFEEVG